MFTFKVSSTRLLVIFLWLVQQQNLLESASAEIECVPLTQCPVFMRLLKKQRINRDIGEFLRSSQCGFVGKEPKVWCPQLSSCTTPDFRNGSCTPIKECKSYINLMENTNMSDPLVTKYLKEFRCSTEFEPVVKVCCAAEKTTTTTTTTTTISTMITTATPPPDPGEGVHQRFLELLPQPQQEECGRRSESERIVGGELTGLDEYPWIALLRYDNKVKKQYACSGTLVNQKNIITASHCVDSYITNRKGVGELYSVVLGEYDTRNETDCIYLGSGADCADPPKEYFIEKIILHPNYKYGLMANDIALIRLAEHVTYTDFIQPICLPIGFADLQGNENFTISGFGKTLLDNRSPVKLKAQVQHVSKEKCNKLDPKRNLTAGQICAGTGNGVDSCYGDSGGPLMLEIKVGDNVFLFLYGVISYGYGQVCGNFPGVYTYIPTYLDWITENIG